MTSSLLSRLALAATLALGAAAGGSAVAQNQTPACPNPAAPVINGTPNGENLNGTTGEDRINGGAGDDTIDAVQGNDCVLGGEGFDTVAAVPAPT